MKKTWCIESILSAICHISYQSIHNVILNCL